MVFPFPYFFISSNFSSWSYPLFWTMITETSLKGSEKIWILRSKNWLFHIWWSLFGRYIFAFSLSKRRAESLWLSKVAQLCQAMHVWNTHPWKTKQNKKKKKTQLCYNRKDNNFVFQSQIRLSKLLLALDELLISNFFKKIPLTGARFKSKNH